MMVLHWQIRVIRYSASGTDVHPRRKPYRGSLRRRKVKLCAPVLVAKAEKASMNASRLQCMGHGSRLCAPYRQAPASGYR